MRPRFTKIRDNRDQNHGQIVAALRKHGVEVIETERPLDCLIYRFGRAGWIEIKADSRNAKIRRGQLEFMSLTKMPVAFVKTEAEAVEFAASMIGLTEKQKHAIAIFLAGDKREEFYPATVEAVIT